MKHENEIIRALFEPLSPDAEQKERMMQVILQKGEGNMKKRISMRAMLAAAVAALLVTTGCVCAAVPAVREYINMLFLRQDSVSRIHEVPEGWVGIWTAEDLEKVREDLDGSYVLMNDIVIPEESYAPGGIYENGFVPIGGNPVQYTVVDEETGEKKQFTRSKAFTGIFNGNGYVISNIHVTELTNSDAAGLFGVCEMQYDIWDPETGEGYQKAGGIIKNLGVTDSSVMITDNTGYFTDISIGMIAGKCGFVVGCYTENVEIQYTIPDVYQVPHKERTITIGGVAGTAQAIDSCYSDADIHVDAVIPEELVNLYAAGVCGWSKACVTSYFCGTIESTQPDWEVCYFDTVDPPDMVNETVMREIAYRLLCDDYGVTFDREKLLDMTPSEMRSYVKENAGTEQKRTGWEHWNAFYCPKTNIASQDFLTYAVDETIPELVYVLDPELTGKERSALSEILSRVFTGDEFYRICQENGVKYGAYDNYDLRREPDCAFEGFDFGSIWIMGDDGLPKLRLFRYSTEDGVTTYESPLQGVIRK